MRHPPLYHVFLNKLVQAPAASLVEAMRSAKNQNVRRLAASYLGGQAQTNADIAGLVVEAYRFDPDAAAVAWAGGPLFVPGLAWNKQQARALCGQLVRWQLWCERNNKQAEQRQIHNNLRSLSLARVAGYNSPGWQPVGTDRWLTVWAKVVGLAGLEQILEEQGVANQPRYQKILQAKRVE